MQTATEITFRHFEPTDRIRERIDEHIASLANFEDAIVGVRVVVDGKNRHGSKTVVEITVELSYRGGTAVGKRSGEFPSPAGQQTFDTALAGAFHTAESQMKQHFKKKRPQDVKEPEAQPLNGRVVRLNPGPRNGFIETPEGANLFFSDAVYDGDFDSLEEGDEVIAVAADSEGAYGPQARQVKSIAPLG